MESLARMAPTESNRPVAVLRCHHLTVFEPCFSETFSQRAGFGQCRTERDCACVDHSPHGLDVRCITLYEWGCGHGTGSTVTTCVVARHGPHGVDDPHHFLNIRVTCIPPYPKTGVNLCRTVWLCGGCVALWLWLRHLQASLARQQPQPCRGCRCIGSPHWFAVRVATWSW